MMSVTPWLPTFHVSLFFPLQFLDDLYLESAEAPSKPSG